MVPHRRSARRAPLALAALLLALAVSPARATDIQMTFGSLPSAQGFTYVATGAHAGVPEAGVFAAAGGVLTQNTIGQYAGTSGAGLFYQLTGGITTTEVKQLRVRARCLQVQGSSVYPQGQGGALFSFATGSVQYGFGLTDSRLFILQPSGYVLLGPSFDNTQFHDYVLEYAPPSTTTLYRDGVLVSTASGGTAIVANRILFGDSTGGANAHVEIGELRFIQDLPTPADGTTWGRVKSLYR